VFQKKINVLQRWRSRARAKAIMLSIWDSKVKESMRIDLWTKDMPVDEMKIFSPNFGGHV
jgi:gliding motility-associated protein GldC